MPVYSVDDRVFELFPEFNRAVIIATTLDNGSRHDGDLNEALMRAAQNVPLPLSAEATQRISAWNDAYVKLGINPKKFTPSIQFLYDQIQRGKPPRSINKVVDIINITSIRWTIPCGGDDLSAIAPGDLKLGMATGDEIFAPLFRPDAMEHPNPGEIIYYTPQSKRVMCRRWTWRNADFSKITPETSNVAINIDCMTPPLNRADMRAVALDVAALLQQHCGAKTSVHELSSATPKFEFDLV